MEILIVAKTKWGEYFCIGGVELTTNKYVRLMRLNGGYQLSNTQFKVGQVWEVDYKEIPAQPPHVEDVKVLAASLIGTMDPKLHILKNCNIWQGDLSKIYNSKLKWENGSGFLNDPNNLPTNSVGFWQNDKDLVLNYNYYNYNKVFASKKIPYKGEIQALDVIPAGTLTRVSLAKWWRPKDKLDIEERCYLQLSGWYN